MTEFKPKDPIRGKSVLFEPLEESVFQLIGPWTDPRTLRIFNEPIDDEQH